MLVLPFQNKNCPMNMMTPHHQASILTDCMYFFTLIFCVDILKFSLVFLLVWTVSSVQTTFKSLRVHTGAPYLPYDIFFGPLRPFTCDIQIITYRRTIPPIWYFLWDFASLYMRHSNHYIQAHHTSHVIFSLGLCVLVHATFKSLHTGAPYLQYDNLIALGLCVLWYKPL